MFYTLASKIPALSKGGNKLLKIFIFGSLIYILLHYYLHSGERWFLLDKLKTYLYYVMVVDFGVAYVLSKWNNSSSEETDRSDEPMSNEQKNARQRDIEELRRMQIDEQKRRLHEKVMEQMREQAEKEAAVEENELEASHESPFLTKDEVEKKDVKQKDTRSKDSKKSLSQRESSDRKSDKKKVKAKKSKEKELESDTHISAFKKQ